MSITLIISYLIILGVMTAVIVNTNSPTKALAYLMLIYMFPVLGIIIYLSIGLNYRKKKLYHKKLLIDEKKFPELENQLHEYHAELFLENSQKVKYFKKLAKNNRKNFLITGSNTTEILINGEEKFPKLLQDLRNAKRHIHIEYYIYQDDVIGNQIGEILSQKAKEGVQVRLMYDDFGSKTLSNQYKEKLKKAGVEVVPFYKIKWWLFANGINYRNHRKIVVIDAEIAYIGGINISDKYINDGKYKLFWRDTHLRVKGMAANALQYYFLIDWNFCAQQNLEFSDDFFNLEIPNKNETGELVQIVSSGPDSDHPNILYAMIQAVLLSKKKILIATPYFIPDDSFIDALKIAKLSGAEIKILIPGISDSALVNAVSNSYYEDLLEIGIEIYQYQKGFVHAKTMVCDERVSFIGTANLDQRSFDLNFEIHSIIYDEKLAKRHVEIMEEDFRDAKKIDLKEWKERPYFYFFTERVARLISPLM